MADYNTFTVVDCKTKKALLTTSSARKAGAELVKGKRIDVWNQNEKVNVVYDKTHEKMKPYISAEKEYIRAKQAAAEERNARRKRKVRW